MRAPADVTACAAILRDRDYRVVDLERYFAGLEVASGITLTNVRAQIARLLFFVPGERHVELRRSVLAFFRPATVAAWQPAIARSAENVLERLTGRDEVDLVADFAAPVSAETICRVLGLPVARRHEYDAWAEEARWLTEPMLPMRRLRRIDAALAAFAAAVGEAIDAGPPAEAQGLPTFLHHPLPGLSREDRLWLAIVLYGAGQSTLHTLANILYRLLSLPEKRRAVLADPARRMAATDRLIAACGSIQFISRMTGSTGNEGGVGEMRIDLPLAEANFAALGAMCPLDAGALHPFPHLAFGAGAHKCVGALLARLIVAEGLSALVRRHPAFAAARPPRGFQSSVVIVSPLDLPCNLHRKNGAS
ncbi:MAG TPA: hypothetical protein VHM92_00510 [Allosphingosinicella sp.]|nr:hypothetical protein [Allosphingosinicella sp.]